MMQAAGGEHGKIAGRLCHWLTAYTMPRKLGHVLTAETGFLLARDPDTVRVPDVSFLRAGRAIAQGFVEGAPELVVEIVSPSDRRTAVADKVLEWIEAGASAVWVVSPRARTVTVHEGAQARILEESDTLDGGSVVPGFTLDLGELFS